MAPGRRSPRSGFPDGGHAVASGSFDHPGLPDQNAAARPGVIYPDRDKMT